MSNKLYAVFFLNIISLLAVQIVIIALMLAR